jgi:hypothetical protein
MTEVAVRKRGGGAARPLTAAELALATAVRDQVRSALQERWPGTSWSTTRSRAQDGIALRIAIVWRGGPSEGEVVGLLEQLALPTGHPFTFSLRRYVAMADNHHPVLHRIQR